MSKTLPSYTSGTAEVPLLGMTIGEMLDRTAEKYPDNEALVCLHQDIRWTYKEFVEKVDEAARAFMAIGVKRGDRVGIWSPNRYEWTVTQFATAKVGAILVNINPAYGVHELQYALNLAGITTLVTADSFKASNYREMIYELAPELKRSAPGKLKADNVPDLRAVINVHPDNHEGMWTWQDFLGFAGDVSEADLAKRQDELQFDDPINIQFTSGTTGNPKGVVYHHRGAYLLAIGNIQVWGMSPHPIYLWTLPMFHCNGWCFPWTITALAGTHVCLRNVRAGAIYDTIAEHGVTHLCGAPIVMQLLLGASEEEKRDFDQQVKFMTAAAPPPAAVLAAMQDAGIEVTHVYGLTEVYGPAVVCAWHQEWDGLDIEMQAALKSRQGVNYPVLEGLMVADAETLAPVPRDGETLGEVFMRGNVVMKGYLKNPDATDKAFAGGWFHTGDLGVWHPDGYIELKDRSKDIIISGGENISSIEIENALYRHPAVAGAAVVAKPDDKWGETPCAFVELKPGTQAEETEIIAFCRNHLAHFKAPRKVVFGPLPKTSTGKIQKFVLRSQAKGL